MRTSRNNRSLHARRTLVAIAAAAVVLPALAAAQASPGADYFYDANGRCYITASPAEALVFATPTGRGERPAFLPGRVTPDGLPDPAVELESRMELRGLYVVRGRSAEQLARHSGVVYALPLLYRVGSDVPIYPTNRLIVAFRPDLTAAAIRAVAEAAGCDAERCERGINRYILTVRDVRATPPLVVANALHERRDLTVYAHPDFLLPKVAYSPPVIQDPYYLSHQWHLDGDTSKGAEPNTDINVEAAWDTNNGPAAQGVSTVRVAILDECVEKWHPDLLPNWATGRDYDVVPPDDDPSPDGGQRHGTSCAGVAVAAGNTIGVRGAAPSCGLIGVKFFGATIAEMADSYYFCGDPDNNGDHSDGAAVLSNSWGFADGTLQPSDVVTAINWVAVNGRNGRGCLVLFAAANNDHTIDGVSALAQLPTVSAIGGTTSNNMHTEFSDVGPELAMAAPTNDRGDDGVRLGWLDITTVDNTGSSGYNGLPDLDYTNQFGGTSSATPLAAGVLALIISQDPNMTAAEARAIAQHTSVRIEEPYGRFDGITGHSHRLGFGRLDAGAAVTAAHAGIRWPDRIKNLSATGAGANVALTWDTPTANYADSMLVRSTVPFAWMPADGATYNVSDQVAPGVFVVHKGAAGAFIDTGAASGAFFYGVYARSSQNRYGFGAKAYIIRDAFAVFADNCEIPNPGWTHGGPGDEWARGTPTAANSIFGQSVAGSGPLAGLDGLRAIGGSNCWGTDLSSTYNAYADAWLQTPLLNLTGVTVPVYLEYWDWCLLETYYDQCVVEVVNAQNQVVGTINGDTGGDYDWTKRIYDLSAFAGQPIKIRFRLTSDGLLQRDGWFLDEIRVLTAGAVPLPPAASDVYAETPQNTLVQVTLSARDPNPGTLLDYVIWSLPANGTLSDPNGGTISTTPYTLLANGVKVNYTPAAGYQGPDSFTYVANDGGLNSNVATVSLSVGTPLVVYDYPLNTNPGWQTEGLWQFGHPQGLEGDPTAAYTGLYVYGYNLAGAYTNNMPPRRLTTLPFNCTGLSRVTLSFARWLGVEAANWDSASIEATSDGNNWYTVWSHTGTNLVETAWSLQSYNIGAIADGQPFVQVRWTLGPTDGADVYAGWNIDDVQFLGIGTPPTNQPPYARPAQLSTAKNVPLEIVLQGSDADLDPLDYTIVSLPEHGQLSDPGAGVIAAVPYTLVAGGNTVDYAPAPDFAGNDGFTYQVDDGELGSNVATISIETLDPAPFPFTEDFEAGPPLAVYWQTASTGTGRIRVNNNYGPIGTYHLTMDSSYDGSYGLNEVTLVVDLEGHSYVRLEYDWKDFSDETHALPGMWVGSAEGDGVAISADGVTWHRIANLFDPGALRGDVYQTAVIDLDQAAAAAGLTYTNTFRIRFQQYDNNPIDADGIAIDNIQLIQGTTDPLISTSSLPAGLVDEPYGPLALEALGGDLPLVWSVLDVYGEEELGANLYAATGTARGWIGGNTVYDYTLPFAFPFYGQYYTQVKVAVDGWINFGAYVGSTYNNSTELLSYNARIAVLWDNLRTDQPGNDIFVDETVPGEVTVRWVAVTHTGLYPCEFSATLCDDGRIRLHYGPGNTNLTPTIGVSAGDQANYTLSAYDNAATLTDADSVEFDQSRLPPGMMLSPAGVLSGTPTEVGRFKPIFHIVDQAERMDARMIPLTVIPDLYGDYDRDGDVDLDDFESFRDCMEQPVPAPQCLAVFDDNEDSVIDLADFALFQAAFTGPGEP